jgi:hypothetical protein
VRKLIKRVSHINRQSFGTAPFGFPKQVIDGKGNRGHGFIGTFTLSLVHLVDQFLQPPYLYELPKYWGIVEKKTDKIYIIPKTSIPMLPPEALPKGFTYGRVATPPAAAKAPAAAPAAVKAPAAAAEVKAPAVADLKAAAANVATPPPAPAAKVARSVDENIAAARKYLIPTGYGLPNEGKALGEVLDASQKLGTHVLRILAGRIDGMAIPNPFVATSKEEKQVKAAAEFLLDNAAPVAA